MGFQSVRFLRDSHTLTIEYSIRLSLSSFRVSVKTIHGWLADPTEAFWETVSRIFVITTNNECEVDYRRCSSVHDNGDLLPDDCYKPGFIMEDFKALPNWLYGLCENGRCSSRLTCFQILLFNESVRRVRIEITDDKFE